ncbi:uncharacterized protein LOC105309493 isoform X1 [Pteropus vampyrus]|uniref:Uncharacterized protein LOC105309493 isoform X1 n=1 Tax=Pteropus vampyrus TaxID=132908 RepID=A0A6P6C4D0_PTEVA|nr:uncharacterized protein LOC105309493 isoform X1 [Pteropus vampyrus]XP_023382006.1 uncharacterized protein LOC105309493 isoform X1 [Pteropus vampyrus]
MAKSCVPASEMPDRNKCSSSCSHCYSLNSGFMVLVQCYYLRPHTGLDTRVFPPEGPPHAIEPHISLRGEAGGNRNAGDEIPASALRRFVSSSLMACLGLSFCLDIQTRFLRRHLTALGTLFWSLLDAWLSLLQTTDLLGTGPVYLGPSDILRAETPAQGVLQKQTQRQLIEPPTSVSSWTLRPAASNSLVFPFPSVQSPGTWAEVPLRRAGGPSQCLPAMPLQHPSPGRPSHLPSPWFQVGKLPRAEPGREIVTCLSGG